MLHLSLMAYAVLAGHAGNRGTGLVVSYQLLDLFIVQSNLCLPAMFARQIGLLKGYGRSISEHPCDTTPDQFFPSLCQLGRQVIDVRTFGLHHGSGASSGSAGEVVKCDEYFVAAPATVAFHSTELDDHSCACEFCECALRS